jgi:hypothetical protein
MNHPAISAKPATQRARRYRERKKTGARCLQIELAGDDIDAFVRIGVLAAERRDDSEAIKAAIRTLCRAGYRALKETRDTPGALRPVSPSNA